MKGHIDKGPFCAFSLGITALLIAGVQPLLLEAWLKAGRLSLAQLGPTAAVELLALGLSCGLASARLQPRHLKRRYAIACLVHASANITSLSCYGLGLIACRGVCGLAAGVMVWAAVLVIARSAQARRQAAIFACLQTAAQLLVVLLIPWLILPAWGWRGILLSLATLSLLGAVMALTAPDQLPALPTQGNGPYRFHWRVMLALVAVFLQFAAITSLWVYLEPLALNAGLSSSQARNAVAWILAFQMIGGVLSVIRPVRAAPAGALGWLVAGIMFAMLLWSQALGNTIFVVACALFGLLWLMLIPVQTAWLVQLDRTRHGVMQLGTAQLLGCSAGPLLAGCLIDDTHFGDLFGLAAACLIIALAAVAVVSPPRLWRLGYLARRREALRALR
jgi:DHA1 family inner membrane transport protein